MRNVHRKAITFSPLRIALLYALLGSLWIAVTSSLLLDLNVSPAVLAGFELTKGLGFIAVTSVLIYFLLTYYSPRQEAAANEGQGSLLAVGARRRLITLFVALLLVVPSLVLVITMLEAPRLEAKAYEELQTIAQLKSEQVRNWLDERHSDGMTLSEDPEFLRQVAAALTSDSEKAQDSLRHRLAAFRNAHHYEAVSLLDSVGQPRLQLVDTDAGISPAWILDNWHNHDQFTDMIDGQVLTGKHDVGHEFIFHSDDVHGVHMHLLFGLRRTAQEAAFAILQVDIHADRFLFPYITRWPTASASGETLLATVGDSRVLVLTPLRHREAQPGTLTLPLSNSTLSAAAALRSGGSGTYSGRDYRDAEVLAAYHPVAGTSWRLIAKLDRNEVMAPLYTLTSWVGTIGLIAAVLIGLLLLHNGRQQRQLAALHIETERRKTDTLLQQFLNLPFIGIAITLPHNKHWLRFNDRLCEIFGYPRDELTEMSWTELTPPDELEADMVEFDRMMRGESDGYNMDKRLIRKDGSLVDAFIDVKCIRKDSGEAEYFVAMVQDISERKASERRLRTVINTIPDPVWLKDADGIYLACNPMFERFFGASEAEIVGKTDHDFVDRELADFFREHDRKAMAADEPSSNEETLISAADGYRGTFETIKTPMRDGDGRLLGVLGIARDITERKQNSARLEYLSRLYATLSQTNQAIVRSHNEEELFEEICRSCVEHGGFAMAWIGLLDDANSTIEPISHYGDHSGYLKTLSLSSDPEHRQGLGPTGTSIREGRPYWCQDFLHSDSTSLWHEGARQAGFAASAALPLRRGGKVIGSLNIYAGQINAFDTQARELLEEMATDIAFALDNFDRERLLLETEERLQLVIKGSNDSPWDWDLETDCFWDASNWWHLLGYEAGELPLNSSLWRELAHPDDVDAVAQALARIRQPGNEWAEVECRLRHKHGHYIPILIRGLASRNDEGQVVRLTGTLTDLTDRKRMEEELRRQRDELLRAKQLVDSHLDHSPLGVIEWDRDFRIIRWSDRAEEIFGWCEDEVMHKHPGEFNFIFDEDADEMKNIISGLMSGNQPKSDNTNRNYTRAGEVVDIQWFNSAIYDDQGRLVTVLSLAQDITEQRAAEQSLRESEARFRLALSSLPISVWQMDSDLRYTWIYEHEQPKGKTTMLGKLDSEVYAKTDAAYLTQLKQQVLDTGEPLSKEVYLTVGGELQFYNYIIEPLKDEQDDIQGLTGAAVNITAMRELEKARKTLSDALKQSASAIAMIDTNLKFEFANEAFEELFGFRLGEIAGKSISLIYPPPSIEPMSATKMKERVLRQKRFQGERVRQKKGGELIPIYLKAAPLVDPEGEIIGFVADYSDLRPLKQSEERVRDALSGTITAVSHTIEKRDPYTAGHQERVAELAVAIAKEMSLSPQRTEGIRLGSLIHDIGKIYIPSEILTRPGKLSTHEFEIIKSHPEVGYEIIRHVKFEWPIAEMVYQHHERIDGSGYPQGLKGEEISLEARIVAVADIVEAMTSHRPYRAGLGLEVALAQIESEAGKTLDKEIVDSCLRLFREKGFNWSSSF